MLLVTVGTFQILLVCRTRLSEDICYLGMTIDTKIRLGLSVEHWWHRLMVTVAALTVAADHLCVMPFVTLSAVGIFPMCIVTLVTGYFGMGATSLGEGFCSFCMAGSATVSRQIFCGFTRRRVVGVMTTQAVFLDFAAGMTVVTVEAIRNFSMLRVALAAPKLIRMNRTLLIRVVVAAQTKLLDRFVIMGEIDHQWPVRVMTGLAITGREMFVLLRVMT